MLQSVESVWFDVLRLWIDVPHMHVHGVQASSPSRTKFSMLKDRDGLPPNVHLLSLHDDGSGVIMFRLIHIFLVRSLNQHLH